MHVLLWILQVFGALTFGASGYMKLFMFDKISAEVPSFAALPRGMWTAMGFFELVCVAGLILPGVLRWQPSLTPVSATILALETLIFIWVHARYNEFASIAMSAALGLIMAFIAYGRFVLRPIE